MTLTLVRMPHPSVVTAATVEPPPPAAAANVSATCRDRFGLVDVVSFRRRACTLCFIYLFPGVGNLIPSIGNYTQLVRLNGSTVVERHVVDSADTASLEHVCGLYVDEVGGPDGCTRWIQCCTKADTCCQRQRLRSRLTYDDVAPVSCAATWDGFSCWDRTPAGTVVHQQCSAAGRRLSCRVHSIASRLSRASAMSRVLASQRPHRSAIV